MKFNKHIAAVIAAILITAGLASCDHNSGPIEDTQPSSASLPATGASGVEGSTNTPGTDAASATPTPSLTADPDDPLLHTPPEEIALEDTRTYAALQLLEGDTYMIDMQIGFNMQLYRRGDDINVYVASSVANYILDGKRYRLSYRPGEEAAYYRPATQEDYEEVLGYFSGFDSFLSLEGKTLTRVGLEMYGRFGELYYEEFTDDDGEILGVYFNHNLNNELFALYANVGGNMRRFRYHVSATVPDEALEIPPELEIHPEPS
ncbi:MAG: hypothetical protein FWD35_04335 [Oscillospiraceae bacterium]|nr:hypothetical protein [Oscillospiraceae bacterium]